MTSLPMLPVILKRLGNHNIVRLARPDVIDLSQPFFWHGVPDKGDGLGIAAFDDWLAAQPEPDADLSDFGAIFHVSRCGSTLLSRNIREIDQAVVLSEPPFFRILGHRMWDTVDDDTARRACLAMLDAWRKWARSQGKPLVIKFSSYLNRQLSILLQLLEGARFVFLYREPLGVLESLDRKAPEFIKRDAAQENSRLLPSLRSIDADARLLIATDGYCRALQAFGAIRNDSLLCVEYSQLERRYDDILRHLMLDPEKAEGWSDKLDAKAIVRDGDQPRPYIPVSQQRLEQFGKANAEVLEVARTQYRDFINSAA